MDRDRLKEVHATDLTESRVNEDFVDWLKTKAPTYLVVALLVVAGWMFFVRWQQRRATYRNEAWTAYLDCELPSACEDVAIAYADVPTLPQQARRRAADSLLAAVQTGAPIGAENAALSQSGPVKLTAEERADYLTRADRLYKEIIESDDGSMGLTLHVASAMKGRAVVAECRGETAEAVQLYTLAAERTLDFYRELSDRLREKADVVAGLDEVVILPGQAAVPRPAPPPAIPPATIDSALRELLPAPTGAG